MHGCPVPDHKASIASVTPRAPSTVEDAATRPLAEDLASGSESEPESELELELEALLVSAAVSDVAATVPAAVVAAVASVMPVMVKRSPPVAEDAPDATAEVAAEPEGSVSVSGETDTPASIHDSSYSGENSDTKREIDTSRRTVQRFLCLFQVGGIRIDGESALETRVKAVVHGAATDAVKVRAGLSKCVDVSSPRMKRRRRRPTFSASSTDVHCVSH